ncbi:hypothetical protein ABFS83_11G091800 [Erythranthe nasuta]
MAASVKGPLRKWGPKPLFVQHRLRVGPAWIVQFMSAVGDYGNCCIHPTATTTSESLLKNPYHYALELLRKAKLEAMADPMIIKCMSRFSFVEGYAVSDARLRLRGCGFRVGKAVYGGVAKGNIGFVPELLNVYMPCKNNKLVERLWRSR